ncbi:MAG: thioredoxin domain-containing protein, partial [Proteobacteria bacterium]|nr:thioredoxin domain-containing protein [Pseudomonadota bacterium]
MARKKNRRKKSRKTEGTTAEVPPTATAPTTASPVSAPPSVAEKEPLTATDSVGGTRGSLPNWVFSIPLWLLVLLALIGVGIGVFLTYHHELLAHGGEATGHLWGCESTGKVNCDDVNNSPWSEILGVPLATWSVPTYLLIAGLALMAAMGRRRVLPLLVAIGVAASLFSVFLYYISIVELERVCAWCMRMYFINGATLVLPFLSGRMKDLPSLKLVAITGMAFALTNGLAIGVQKMYRATLLVGTPDLPELVEEPATLEPSDPEGKAPVLSWEITTEDKNVGRLLTTSPADAWKGNPEAKVAIVEFADFECGYCKRVSGQLKRVYEAYKDQVVFVFKHYAMDPACNPGVNNKLHRYACSSSIASKCAQRQGYFWAFHDLAFKNQHQLKVEHLRTYAEAVGLDMEEFDRCTRENVAQVQAEVVADGEAGEAIDIHGTPRLYINGKLYRAGTSAQQMARQVEIELGATAEEAA